MARILKINEDKKQLESTIIRVLQSGSINLIIGSGASLPAIPLAGTIEKEIEALHEQDKTSEAHLKAYDFIRSMQEPANRMIDEEDDTDIAESINNYKTLVQILEHILAERKANTLPKQVNLFTTNYDLLIEKAASRVPGIVLNDGFNRTPDIKNEFCFSPKNFFNSIYNHGNLFSYKVETPSINLIKIHGSLSWKKKQEEIMFEVKTINGIPEETKDDETIADYLNQYTLILPQKGKFRETLLDRTYYDLLRIYTNELDKENSLLIAFGFSFVDEHIYDITRRALKNPTLIILIVCYETQEAERLESVFKENNNVQLISPSEDEKIDFDSFNAFLRSIFSTDD